MIIKELERLGQNMEAIRLEWNILLDDGVDIVVIDTPIISTLDKIDIERKLISNIVFELLGYMAKKERIMIKRTQSEVIKAAKRKGVVFERPRVNIDSNNFLKNVLLIRVVILLLMKQQRP